MRFRRDNQVLGIPITAEVEPVRARMADPKQMALRAVENQLDQIHQIIMKYPGCPKQEGTLEEIIPKNRLRIGYGFEDAQLKAVRASDGLFVGFKKPAFLYDGGYELLLPDKADPQYSFQPYNVNSQLMPPQSVEITGVEAIASQKRIAETLSYCAGMLAVEASYGWQNAFKARL